MVLAALATASCSRGHTTLRPVRSAPASAAPIQALSRPGFCGSYVVVHHGQVVATRTAGVSGASTANALFDIGSAAKSITAVTVLRLAQERRLDINQSIAHYLPRVPADNRTVTIAQLLSHTSGFPENFASDRRRIDSAAATRAILALHRRHPGRFTYSNAGYTLLAAIVQAVAHQPFRQVVERTVLQPVGMTHTGWYDAPPRGAVPVHGHVAGRDTGPAGSQAPASWATLGAGGMTSTGDDMARWLTAVSKGSVLDRRSTDLMFAPREPAGPPGASVAFGWVVGDAPAGPIRTVGGETDYGFTSDLRLLPRDALEIAVLSCSDAAPANEIGHELQAFYGHG